MERIMKAILPCVLCLCSCRADRKTEPPEVPPAFSFAATNETVEAREIPMEKSSRFVTADFNMDGLQDLAIIETAEDGDRQVSLYIRKSVSNGEMKDLISYYKGGAIRLPTADNIIGIMSRRRERFTDLILLMARPGSTNEMIHFHNNGAQFSMSAPKDK